MSRSISSLRTFSSIACPKFAPAQNFALQSRLFHSSPVNMTIHNIRDVNEFKEVIGKNQKVIIDSYATWCAPCKQIAPVMAKLSEAEEFEDIYFAKFDVDEAQDLSQELGVTAMPTFFYFEDGKPVEKMQGANPGGLVNMLKKHT